MAETAFKQDMPPPGGYGSVHCGRIPAQKYFSRPFFYTNFAMITVFGLISYKLARHRYCHYRIEVSDRDCAIEPFFAAERDRAFLKHLKRTRAEEEKIFEGVSNWKVGHFWNIPIYRTLPEDYHVDPSVEEFFAHTSTYDAHHIWCFPYLHFHHINF